MSIHLMLIAGYLPRDVIDNPTEKLVLMKIADSADDENRLSRPGMHRLAAWAGVGENRVVTLITKLVKKGLVERVEVGRPGRTAVYRVFPLGVPQLPQTEELKERQAAAAAAPRNSRLARPNAVRSKPAPPARTYRDVEKRERKAAEESGLPQGNPPEGEGRVSPGKPSALPRGNPEPFPGETPSFLPPTSIPPTPPPPTADAEGEPVESEQAEAGSCPRHRRPAKNCRACGTSARAQRQAAEAARKKQEQQAEQDRFEALMQEGARRRAQADANREDVQNAQQEARAAAREGRERHGSNK
ncbi:helix-turn-helix domain-containing protein [Kitasatospora cineracea]